jgi:hypothetical protein
MPAYPALIDLSLLDGLNGVLLLSPGSGLGSGFSLTSGDFDGDGLSDLVIGAPFGLTGRPDVVLGRTGNWGSPLDLGEDTARNFAFTGEVGSSAGWRVEAADLNDDGRIDFIISSPDARQDDLQAGAVDVVFGRRGYGALDLVSLAETDPFVRCRIWGEDGSERFGERLATGDLNGDGVDDLVIGAPDGPNGPKVVFGHRGDWGPVFEGPLDGENGFEVGPLAAGARTGAGLRVLDFDGNGIGDLAIGSPEHSAFDGRVDVLLGRQSWEATVELTDDAKSVTFTGFGNDAGGGEPVAGGDLNGDGRDDLVITGQYTGFITGSVWVAFGSGEPPGTIDVSEFDGTNGLRIDGLNDQDLFGCAVDLGDVNNDGFDDLVIAARGAAGLGRTDAGLVYVIFGQRAGWGAAFDLADIDGDNGMVLVGPTANQYLGFSVEVLRDANGDGLTDLAIGGWQDEAAEGRTALVFGRLAQEAVRREGTAADNEIHGGLKGDTLIGGEGDDILIGHEDDDRLKGEGGRDLLQGGAGNDDIDGGAGRDRVSYEDSPAGVTVDLNKKDFQRTGQGRDRLTSVEHATGSDYGDTISGTAQGNALAGGEGADHLAGRGGRDTLTGGGDADSLYCGGDNDRATGDDGFDTLHGEEGNDTLEGGRDKDTLDGGSEDDVLDGGRGGDQLTGGTGADRFVYRSTKDSRPGGGATPDNDTITDFSAGDILDLSLIEAIPGSTTSASTWSRPLPGPAARC